mmetsp:Transcript_52583/g.127358  ORF Transcript_52583/g.127358 Transcript_52583/m.127358 type:complete len:209 (+) Transcript_52583:1441-2067(+)
MNFDGDKGGKETDDVDLTVLRKRTVFNRGFSALWTEIAVSIATDRVSDINDSIALCSSPISSQLPLSFSSSETTESYEDPHDDESSASASSSSPSIYLSSASSTSSLINPSHRRTCPTEPFCKISSSRVGFGTSSSFMSITVVKSNLSSSSSNISGSVSMVGFKGIPPWPSSPLAVFSKSNSLAFDLQFSGVGNGSSKNQSFITSSSS